jgi:hypothetical protein
MRKKIMFLRWDAIRVVVKYGWDAIRVVVKYLWDAIHVQRISYSSSPELIFLVSYQFFL